MAMATRVVCLGGGYVALRFAKELRKPIRDGVLDVTIVSRDNFHTFHGFVHEMLAGKVQPGQIISPARRLFPPARFYNCEIEAIDLDRRTVIASRLLDGQQYALEFDHLVLALGSVDDLSRYAGIAEHAQRLKTYADCFRARNHILSMLELAEIESNKMERNRLLTFVIAGGNFGGIEIATELHDHLHALTRREYSRIPADELKVVIVHGGERILPELRSHPRLVAWAEAQIARKKIEVRLNTRVQAATAEEVVLSNGDRISSRTIISCTGTAQSPLLDSLNLPRDQRGRVQTDEFLQVQGHPNIWAGGDCAAVPHPQGGICPQLGIFALTAGRQIARNIKRSVAREPLEKYRFIGIGDACSVGRRRAVAHVRGVGFTGIFAWFAWRLMLLNFVPSWDRKVRLFADWMLWPILGRDIVNMKVDPHYGIRRELFETGQQIIRQGDVGRRLYLIWRGEVEVVRDGPVGEETVGTLGPGQHFGETSVFEDVRRTATVRARTRVEVISIGQQEAIALASATDQFGGLRDVPVSSQPTSQR
jgi:NADH dehydrogenase